MKKLISLFLLLFCLGSLILKAQTVLSLENFNEVNIDQLTDAQVNSFWERSIQEGLDMKKLEEMAMQRKMDPEQFAKFKLRIERSNANDLLKDNYEDEDKETNIKKSTTDTLEVAKLKPINSKIFGADLFSNRKLTFEPNVKIATPPNYQIGPDDELIIDIYGYADASYKLTVTPNGQIRIPNVGLISVGGLTIDQAKQKVTKQLSEHYSTIKSGETSVNVALGNIRSIRVTVLGEVNLPGTYTLSSLSTVFNALYASGGPNKNGSFRNIKLIRGNKVISIIDVYAFLVKGETKGNVALRDQDIIKIEPYETRIEFQGELKRPGLFEVKPNESLKDIIAFAGGFSENAYKERIKVLRKTSKERTVADVPSDMFGVFTPVNGDVFQVGKIIDRYTNRVEIRGAVFRPGIFSIEEGLTVGKLIQKAEGIKEDAFLSRAIIYRLKDDNTSEVISFNVSDVISGAKDVLLKREDIVEINSKLQLKETYIVSIQGEVLKPGVYPFAENARVEDLIVAAGGLKENASKNKIEIARRFKSDTSNSIDGTNTQIINYEVSENLQVKSSILLQPFDIVTVYSIPGYAPQRNILVEGEVRYPGQYSLSSQKDRVSDLIGRSGGVSSNAFIEGAILLRTKKLTKTDEIIRKQKVDAFLKQTKDTVRAKELAAELLQNTSIVGIDLEKILKNVGSKYDIYLEDGDILRVPRLTQTVKISGEVLYPVQLPFVKGRNLKRYINGSGGFTPRALKRKTYVVYANGAAEATTNYILFKNYPKLQPGAEIIVPMKEERRRLSVAEIAALSSSLATLILLIYTVR